MQENEVVMDKTTRATRFVGRRTAVSVPRYYLYGDEQAAGDWFVNVEPLEKRCSELGWVIEPHAHPKFVQIMLVLVGEGSLVVEGESHAFQAPALLVVPTHSIHGIRYREASSGWVVTVADTYLVRLAERAFELTGIWSVPSAVSRPEDGGWAVSADAALRALDCELDDGAPGGVIAAEALLTTFLVTVLRQFSAAGELIKTILPSGPTQLVTRFQALVEQHYRENWDISSYAAALAVSVAQLRGASLTVTGQTPLKLIHERILIEAKRSLVYSGLSVAQIAYQIGFEDPAYFSRFFARHAGEPPAQYRAKRTFDSVVG